MKKLALLALLAPLCACDKPAPQPDFDVVAGAVKTAGEAGIVANKEGKLTVKVPATKEMLAIYAKDKDCMFETGDIARQIPADNCLVEIWSETDYRVFCGKAEDVVAEQMWAVCVKPVEPAQAPAEEPAEPAAK